MDILDGSPSSGSSDNEFDFSQVEEPNFADELQNGGGADETESQTEDSEDGAEEEVVPKQTRGLSREDQSIKDKYYALLGKYEVLTDKIERIEQRGAATPNENAEPDIEQEILERYGEEPVLLKLAKGYKALEKEVLSKREYEGKESSKKVYDTIEQFTVANRKFLENPEIGDKFIDEINDRLPNGDFGELVKTARTGGKFDPNFADKLQKKLEKALAVATGKGVVDVNRQTEARTRVQQRQGTPGGVKPDVAAKTTPAEPKTYKEAIALVRQGTRR